jgi:hypothetical protein
MESKLILGALLVATLELAGSSSTLSQTSSGQSYNLDFISEPSPSNTTDPSKPHVRASPSGVTTHTEQARIPLEIRVSLDRSSYVIGDRVVYELFLKHTGSAPFKLPWSRDPEVVRGASRIETAAFILEFKDEAFGHQLLGGWELLYGSKTVPGSMLELKPGDTIHVRAEGLWYLMSGNYPAPPADGWVRNLSVYGQLQIAGVNNLDALLNSDNAVSVQLGQR